MYGWGVDYGGMIADGRIETLETRRIRKGNPVQEMVSTKPSN